MNDFQNLRFILHVSDFHITEKDDGKKLAQDALKAVAQKLRDHNINVDYLVHTGDVINSSDLHHMAADGVLTSPESRKKYFSGDRFNFSTFTTEANEEEKKAFDRLVWERSKKRFRLAENIMSQFISDLNVSNGNVIICCGNHDALRLASVSKLDIACVEDGNRHSVSQLEKKSFEAITEDKIPTFPDELPFKLFNDLLNKLKVANSNDRQELTRGKKGEKAAGVIECTLGNLNFLVMNTNWTNPSNAGSAHYCVRCQDVIEGIEEIKKRQKNDSSLNVIVAHKPIYEICETVRLPYQRYKRTPFMAKLMEYVGDNGIYLCGDKHTRSIIGSAFHDIPHYMGGEPFTVQNKDKKNTEVEYNLLGVFDGKVEIERKVHLRKEGEQKKGEKAEFGGWVCDICPQDSIVAQLYDWSKQHISPQSFKKLGMIDCRNSWESMSQNFECKNDGSMLIADELNRYFKRIAKCPNIGNPSKEPKLAERLRDGGNTIFEAITETMIEGVRNQKSKNILNLRGEHGTGKSTFLGILYIYLLNQYSIGKIDFIPAYFALENAEMMDNIKDGSTYYAAVRKSFAKFAENVQYIAQKEHQNVCYIIDRLDEQDCWSLSSEDSVGRGILDVLAKYENAWNVMGYGQHGLPYFKNTMPARTYNDSSELLYFNAINVDSNSKEKLEDFVKLFLSLERNAGIINRVESTAADTTKTSTDDGSQEKTEEQHEAASDSADGQAKKDMRKIIRDFWTYRFLPGFVRKSHECPVDTHAEVNSEGKSVAESSIGPKNVEYVAPKGTAEQTVVPDDTASEQNIKDVCDIIRKFRRLRIVPGFIRQNYDYLMDKDEKGESRNKDKSATEVYNYYIDRQHERCVNKLGYSFVEYAPAMAYLFAYKGYTYERFGHIKDDQQLKKQHEMKLICDHQEDIYKAFMFIKKHTDSRDYLIARHYHRELRYYTEHPDERIHKDSILNEFISRNVSVIIRKMWKDPNKFAIIFRSIIQREEVSTCTLSMLLYCLAHIQLYESMKDELRMELLERAKVLLGKNYASGEWEIPTELRRGKDALDHFIKLSLKYTIKIFDPKYSENTIGLAVELSEKDEFAKYSRMHQMLYYQDRYIRGEERIAQLTPGDDTVRTYFDFHHCFNYLLVKLRDNKQYPLRDFDLFTICNLLESRLDQTKDRRYFFSPERNDPGAKAVLEVVKEVIEAYQEDNKLEDQAHKTMDEYLGRILGKLKENLDARSISNG